MKFLCECLHLFLLTGKSSSVSTNIATRAQGRKKSLCDKAGTSSTEQCCVLQCDQLCFLVILYSSAEAADSTLASPSSITEPSPSPSPQTQYQVLPLDDEDPPLNFLKKKAASRPTLTSKPPGICNLL